MKDAITHQKTMCVANGVAPKVKGNFPHAASLLYWIDVSPYDGRSIIDGMHKGKCDLAIVSSSQYAELQAGQYGGDYCRKVRLTDPVAKVYVGVPLNPSFVQPVGVYLTESMYSGTLSATKAKYPPPASRCPAKLLKDPAGLKLKHLSGAFAVILICIIIGLIIHTMEVVSKRGMTMAVKKATDVEKTEVAEVNREVKERRADEVI